MRFFFTEKESSPCRNNPVRAAGLPVFTECLAGTTASVCAQSLQETQTRRRHRTRHRTLDVEHESRAGCCCLRPLFLFPRPCASIADTVRIKMYWARVGRSLVDVSLPVTAPVFYSRYKPCTSLCGSNPGELAGAVDLPRRHLNNRKKQKHGHPLADLCPSTSITRRSCLLPLCPLLRP